MAELVADSQIAERSRKPSIGSLLEPLSGLLVVSELVEEQQAQCVHSLRVPLGRRLLVFSDRLAKVLFTRLAMLMVFAELEQCLPAATLQLGCAVVEAISVLLVFNASVPLLVFALLHELSQFEQRVGL